MTNTSTQNKKLLTTVNRGEKDCPFKINVVEEKYKAKFVGQFCLRDKIGNWANETVNVFWQETPPVEGYSNYFALFIRDGKAVITSGASAVEGNIIAVEANNGEIIYSRCRWDCRTSADGSTWIDGGRDYVRTGVPVKQLTIQVIDGDFYEVENSI